MAYLLPHERELFRLVAQSDAPETIRSEAQQYATLEIDTVIPDLAWIVVCGMVEEARWPGKRNLLREIDRRTRGGG